MIFFLVLGLLAITGVVVVSLIGSNTKKMYDKNVEIKFLKKNLYVAESALRKIANQSPAPSLEANLALEDIEFNNIEKNDK